MAEEPPIQPVRRSSVADETQVEAARRLYDPRGLTYEDSWHPGFAKNFVALADFQPGQRVLDLACGTGLISFLAREAVGPSGHVEALDVSMGMLRQAEEKQRNDPEKWSNLHFRIHDIADLESLKVLEKGTFDRVTCASAIFLLPHAPKALQSWAEFLKPGGLLIVDFPDPSYHVGSIVLERAAKRAGTPLPFYREWIFSDVAIKEAITEAGLQVDKLEPCGQTDFSKTYLDVESSDDVFFSQLINSEASKHLRANDIRPRVQQLFREEWCKAADLSSGKIIEKDCVWIAVGRKPT